MDVRFDGVRVHRGGRLVLDVPALSIESCSLTAILGPNGAGKSTLLRTIAALEKPSAGRLTIDDVPVRSDQATRRLVAFAFQHPVFVSGTLRANLDLALRLRALPREERGRRIEAMAAACGISHVLDRDARALSGGEAQRASLARALILEAPVTLLDEPLAGLDAPSREQLQRDLPRLLARAAGTVVFVTHDRDEAARLASDVVLLLDGKVRAAGPLQEVFSAPPDAEAAAFLGWTVIPTGDGSLAISPGALRPGPGDAEFQLTVAQVIQFGPRWEAIGDICGSAAHISGEGEAPAPGASLCVSAPVDGVLRYPRERGINE